MHFSTILLETYPEMLKGSGEGYPEMLMGSGEGWSAEMAVEEGPLVL